MDERFFRGIREFNEGRFFEAHDVLEDLWAGYRESDRLFLQALIQTAVGFYHLDNGNLKGARSQLSKASSKLESFLPSHWGLSTDALHASLLEHVHVLERCIQSGNKSIDELHRPRMKLSSESYPTIS